MSEGVVVLNPAYGGAAAPSDDVLDTSDIVGTRASDATGGGTISASGSIAGASGSVKSKSSLLLAAEKIDRRAALLSGYLRKKNSGNKWQKRYFEIVGNFWVYYKSASSPEMLCAMDLWKAGTPELVAPSAGDPSGLDPSGESAEFAITWDRYRLFRAGSHGEAVRWVNAILQVQASRPPELVTERRVMSPAMNNGRGAALEGNGDAQEWGSSKDRPKKQEEEEERSAGGVCGSCVVM